MKLTKKIALATMALSLCCVSYALGYATGGSNMGYYYPSFSGFISYNPTNEEMGRYIDEAKTYISNCDADMQRIADARDDAVRRVNSQISMYNINRF